MALSNKYNIVNINISAPKKPASSILIVYTGGTLGMVYDEKGALVPFNFEQILEKVPSLRTFDLQITVIAFKELIDSSNVNPTHWIAIGSIIADNYGDYDGFVVIHGTDTMAYSASAISFMLEGLNKPVIFTGAQLPIGAARSDARENLITALEIASARQNGKPIISEVCIYFDYFLFRGNRAKKVESIHFDAFESENYPPLAESGILIDYKKAALKKYDPGSQLIFHQKFDPNVVILKLFPGISPHIIKSILNISGLKGIVLETFGSGNAPTDEWFITCLREAIHKGMIVLNVSQCNGGRVMQGRYNTSSQLKKIEVLSGSDMTSEAAITKMMFLLGNETDVKTLKEKLITPLCGEMS